MITLIEVHFLKVSMYLLPGYKYYYKYTKKLRYLYGSAG